MPSKPPTTKIILLPILSVLLLSLLIASAVHAQGQLWSGKVIRVTDGDSITVVRQLDDGSTARVRVRLYGIDAPEADQPFGKESGKFVHNMIYGQEVTITDFGPDRYKRTVGIVTTAEGVNVNQRLVAEGLAWVYGFFCTEPICKAWEQMEERARELGLGLWSDDFPIAPWDWRRK